MFEFDKILFKILKLFLFRETLHTVSYELHLKIVNENLKISHDELKTSNDEISNKIDELLKDFVKIDDFSRLSVKVDDVSKILNELKTNIITKREFETFKTNVIEAKKKELAKAKLENVRLRSQLLKIRLQRSKKLRSPYCPR